MENRAMLGFTILLLCYDSFASNAEEAFDIRHHLSTVTRYHVVKEKKKNFLASPSIPNQCSPIHLNLVARHGTRDPTKKWIKDMDTLSIRLKSLVKNAKERGSSLENLPPWLQNWSSPWKGKTRGGYLVPEGEDELYNLGIRIKERFPELFSDNYHPDIYHIRASQVPRASASAVAFGMGIFSGQKEGKHRAFAVASESRANDIMLRFHDCCQNYREITKNQESVVQKLKQPVLDEIKGSLTTRYELNFTLNDISSLWFLCKQEASLFNIIDQACGLFTNDEVNLLEWTDDTETFILRGYGNSLNYRMGVPLLEDVISSMEQAIIANKERHAPGSYEKARLRFAHAETLVPFSCLIGLFLDESEFEKLQREETMELPPKPPQKRIWKDSEVAPFGGNNALVLHHCPSNNETKYFVQVLHNEQPMPMAGCGKADFCPFEVFKEKIASPHLKHNYNNICKGKLEQMDNESYTTKLLEMLSWFF
ncbi:uncharacterized protein LOC111896846 isoform X1 [Lactuca sativa]|uniref:uncharacterized protein LOC111896846 isoform X1 n=2 Tax=Lactuca sativa TaxID=4236 RepID=UPI000CAC3FFF|nr:uncharacterized protein LOC111896846 isoform X1 [Lactuca sativa]